MAHLFSKIVLKDALKNISILDIEGKIALLQEWSAMYQKGELQKKKETAFEATYSEKLFGAILGYSDISGGVYTREKHPKNESNGQTCDIGLGYYSSEKNDTQVVVELKDAGTSIDRPQQREGNMTPIQQGFKYKPLYNSRWVVVSNYYEFRLYRDTYQDYEVWTLADLVNPANDYEKFRTFYLLLHAESLISETGESETEKLLAKVRIEQETITKKFYKEYSGLREELMRDIWKNNPTLRNESVVTITQRIIDRIVFVHFCEDRGLLPQNKLAENLTRAKEIDLTPWEVLMLYFRGIDKGSEKLGIPDGYNGGLFRDDNDVIKKLKVSDDVITKFIELGRYDFSDEGGQLSVEILGHIFEQSISDLESIREKIKNPGGESDEKKVSKRKKDGIFYTPAYIVDYIVRNSLGKYLEEHEERLKEQYKLKGEINEKNYRKRELEAYTEYQKILHNVKVLDPACGSGAFLVRVFDFLISENVRVDKILSGDEQTLSLAERDPSAFFGEILKNNIYGVDLNEESVEITKLSLWLKSAVRGKKLETLDNNIKCGNSLIDDPAVAGEKAFNWNTEFADIMANGGFDVIVGNPPYVTLGLGKNQESTAKVIIDFYKNNYKKSLEYKGNLFALFIEKGISLLKNSGKISYIVPSTLLLNLSFSKIREHILKNAFIYKLLNLRYEVFSDADTGGCVIFGITKHPQGNIQVSEVQTENDFMAHTYGEVLNESLLKSPGFRFYTDVNKLSFITRVFNSGFPILKEIGDFYNGIKTGDNNKFLSESELSSQYKPVFRGRDIDRYLTKKNVMYVLFDPEQLWSNTDEKKLAKNPKILIRQTGDSIIATYDDKGIFPMDTLHSFFDADVNLKYILTILNSQIFNRVFQIFVDEGEKVFAEVKIAVLKELPLPVCENKQPFIDKADFILSLNGDLQEKSSSFLKNISAKYSVSKITRKLEKWWELDFAEFLKETKISISLTEQEELMTYFETRRADVRAIDAEIRKTDAEIDTMVFDLYGLTEEEKKVVLESK